MGRKTNLLRQTWAVLIKNTWQHICMQAACLIKEFYFCIFTKKVQLKTIAILSAEISCFMDFLFCA